MAERKEKGKEKEGTKKRVKEGGKEKRDSRRRRKRLGLEWGRGPTTVPKLMRLWLRGKMGVGRRGDP